MRCLITGANGFIGGHMAEALLAEGGHVLAGIGKSAAWPEACRHLGEHIPLTALELSNTAGIESLLRAFQPDWIFHFAGYANTGRSFKEPDLCWADNVDGTRSLYRAVQASGLAPRILFVSTGLVYGEPRSGSAFDETPEFRPASPYAASKAAADALSFQMAMQPGLDIVRVRLFNQIGPRQSADYAIANFARQIAAIEAGAPPLLETGDLAAQRDITDVRDIVAAFRLLMQHGERGEAYNAARGETVAIRELLNGLLALARCRIEVRSRVDPARTTDTAVTRADNRKIRAATGWQPRISIQQSLQDILDNWRARTTAQGPL